MSKNSITRLYQYRKSLYRLKHMGFVKVFSDNLADAVGVTAAQVRRDFSMFGLSGNKRGGYLVEELIKRLDQKLGKDKPQRVVVIGAGNIGKALMNYKGFESEGIKVAAVFDTDAAKINSGAAVPVLAMPELKEFIRKNHIEVGVIAVPDIFAQQVFGDLVEAGIKGVLNFAPIRLNPPHEDFVINNVNVGLELETVIYLVNSLGNKEI